MNRSLAILALLGAACASAKTRQRFTPERVARIRPGMKSSEILELFGPPTTVEAARGRTSAGQKYIYNVGPQVTDVNFFVFDVSLGEPRLTVWFLGRTAK